MFTSPMDSKPEPKSQTAMTETPAEGSQSEPTDWEQVPLTKAETEEYNPKETSEANEG